MKNFLNGVWCLMLITAVSCSSSAPASPPVTSTPVKVVITFQRSGGLAGANATWLIQIDGATGLMGLQGEALQPLTPAQRAQLLAALRVANIMALNDSYVPQDTCCDRYEYTLTVATNGQSKTIHTIDASPTAPLELTQLIDTLNQLVNTAR